MGVDLGATNLRAGLDDGRRLVSLVRTGTPGTFDELVAVLRSALRSAQEPVEAVGLGIPGAVTPTGRTWVPNVSYLSQHDLAGRLRETLETEVVVANDAQLALLGEARRGAAAGHDDVVLLAIGTGIGGAIMRGGRLVAGAHGTAGAFGWLTLDPADPGDPARGHLERLSSGTAVHERLRAVGGDRAALETALQAGSGKAPAPSAVERLLRDTAELLGAALAAITSALDPQLVVLAGGFGQRLEVLAPRMLAARDRLGSPAGREVAVVWSELEDDAATVGAAIAAREGAVAWL